MSVIVSRIELSFTSVMFRRGRDYFNKGKVVFVKHDEDEKCFRAVVQGSGPNTYALKFNFGSESSKAVSNGICDCPVGYGCKHIAAAALAANAQGLLDSTSSVVGTDSADKSTVSQFDQWLNDANNDKDLVVKTDEEDNEDVNDRIIFYVLDYKSGQLKATAKQAKMQPSGLYNKGSNISLSRLQSIGRGYEAAQQSDKDIANALNLGWAEGGSDINLNTTARMTALLKMIESGRCVYQDTNNPAFTLDNQPSALELRWSLVSPFQLSLYINDRKLSQILATEPPSYIDIEARKAGLIDTKIKPVMLQRLKEIPPLTAIEAQKFVLWFNEQGLASQNIQLELPGEVEVTDVVGSYQPILKICHDGREFFGRYFIEYGDFRCEFGEHEAKADSTIEHDGKVLRWQRDLEAENTAFSVLYNTAGLQPQGADVNGKMVPKFQSSDDLFWANFNENMEHIFLSNGWLIEHEENLVLPKIFEVKNVSGEIESDDFSDWFQLGLSVDINGEKVDLVPLLINTLSEVEDWHALPEFIMFTHNGNLLRVAREQLDPIVKILQQLGDHDGKIARHHAHVLNEIPFVDEWSGNDKIKELAEKLANFDGMEEVVPPKGLLTDLRDYQQQGLNWLNFLQSYGFGGILADDMGLGKTIQALSMMQIMHERGELEKPIMVVCPTSLVGNWRNEAAKFCPDLKVLVLHGSERHKHFNELNDYNLVITTYPLIHRDIEEIDYQYQWVILDEAQVIKNPKAKMTQAVKQLKAQHKLCLTGTPMENHLGELWSLFDFVMPGFLGNYKSFNDLYRKPIENGENYAQNWLNNRIKPFLLRRTKDAVATELPAKTEIIQTLELPSDQRKLYESIRVSMEKKVRDLLKEKGIAKSQIEFLDALLKLRQACCHPKLVKLDEAKKVKNSAKLEFLLEVVPEMVEEGRKILIFSQFTSMLTIIEKALNKIGIDTSKLTGQTRKREDVINGFTNGDTSVFLISLKAGGVGLNLTAADTVIHFDPWWNPAAENQATDRAYRIGQDKPVFVYKLVTENTIEERVLELQRNKQAIADLVYGDKNNATDLLEVGGDKEESKLSQMDATQLLSLFE
jgi:hypothetical protein